MHKRHSSQSAITLTELLISSMLIGIAIVGLISVDTAIRRTQNVSALHGRNIMNLSTALLHMQKDAGDARGLGTTTIPLSGSFPVVQTDPVGVIVDNTLSLLNPATTGSGFCLRHLLTTTYPSDFFNAEIICYHPAATGIIKRIYSLTWTLQSTTNICDQCSFVIQEVPGAGQPLGYLNIELERLANPSQLESDLSNPKFSLQTGFSFNKVVR